jgi:hypothetical protein
MGMKKDEGNQQRPKMYDTLSLITTKDNGRNIQITTMANTVIVGKLIRSSPYELELEVKGWDGKPEYLIVEKHFISTIKFL